MEARYAVLELSSSEPGVFTGMHAYPFRPTHLCGWPVINGCVLRSLQIALEEQLMATVPLEACAWGLSGLDDLKALVRRANEGGLSPFGSFKKLELPPLNIGNIASVTVHGVGLEGLAFVGVELR